MHDARVYYVIHDACVDSLVGHKYVSMMVDQDNVYGYNLAILQRSDQVILCDANGPRYVKNRYGPNSDPIDEQEFAWIKLSSLYM